MRTKVDGFLTAFARSHRLLCALATYRASQREGTLDLESLSRDDQDFLRHFNVPVMLGWVRAMLDWPVIEPAEFLCPTLWLVGSEDQHAIASLKEYEKSLKGTRVQVHIVEGLDHEQVFSEVDRVLPIMLAFTQS